MITTCQKYKGNTNIVNETYISLYINNYLTVASGGWTEIRQAMGRYTPHYSNINVNVNINIKSFLLNLAS